MPELQRETEARIVMLSGLNYSYAEIADTLSDDVSDRDVGRVVRKYEEKARNADDWREVFWRLALADVFGEHFQATLAGDFV